MGVSTNNSPINKDKNNKNNNNPTMSSEVEYDADKGVTFEKTKQSKYMTDKELSSLPLLQRINFLNSTIIFTPLIGLIVGSIFVPLRRPTFILFLVQYLLSGLSITGGYHRCFSHASYRASLPVQLITLAWGAAAFQGSARWWARNHRAHHRYVDTSKDPYGVHKGFWYAHIGWMVLKQDSRRSGRVDISDLNNNPWVVWQHKNYVPIALFFAFVFPLTIATVGWGDFWGALVYACFGRMFFVHQATFCVNSLAHTFGVQTFSKEHTSYDSIITALVTLGEGYHNFHHEFPHDYRNGIKWYHYDPTKWTIRFLSWFGLASRLMRFPKNEIEKARIQVKQQELDDWKQKVDWGVSMDSLKEIDWEEIRKRVDNGEHLIVIEGVVHKVDYFLHMHPGGDKILKFWNGRDATRAFTGEVYKHSKAARNLLANFRVAFLKERLE